MKDSFIYIPKNIYDQLQSHLLGSDIEDTAFAYVRSVETDQKHKFKFLDWDPVKETGYDSRSEFHLNLREDIWANAIKRAHDLKASLVEFHSHSGTRPVSFSGSDFIGFKDFVPHILWRLDKRPYLAVVVNETSYDGLIWIDDAQSPQPLTGIFVGDRLLEPTNLSLQKYHRYEQ